MEIAAGEKAADLIADSLDQDAIMGKTLDRLKSEAATKIDRQQAQIKGQLDQLIDNRLQRHFQHQDEGQTVLSLDSTRLPAPQRSQAQSEPAKRESERAGELAYGRTVEGMASRESQSRARPRGRATRPTDSASDVAWAETPAVIPADAYAYTAGGTYSLPVTLPAGEVALDFTRPSGGAELSIWAVPQETLDNLYGTVAVIVTVLVIAGLVKIWPRSATKRPTSARHIIGYILLLVLLPLLLGLLGLLIALLVILLSEARRGSSPLNRKATA